MENDIVEGTQATTLRGGDFRLEIIPTNGAFEYELYQKEEMLWSGGDLDTYDGVIAELSMVHEALKAIFG